MKEKILALLVAKFPGMRKDGLNQMARTMALHVATEEEAKQLVEKLTDAQVNEVIKEFRVDVDKEVSNATKTFEANLKSKFDFVERGNTVPGGNPSSPTTQTENLGQQIAEAIAKAVQPLNDALTAMKAENVSKTRLQRLNETLGSCKDESFKTQTLKDFNRMSFQDDAAFDEYLADKAKDAETANQRIANETMNRGGGAPMFSQKQEDGVSKGVADYIASKTSNGSPLGGKEL